MFNPTFLIFRGVNMYAMLAGSLPFTVEPFNIKTLHRKMLNSEMNAVPAHLSTRKYFLPCQATWVA